MRGVIPRHPRTRLATYPQCQHGYYVAPQHGTQFKHPPHITTLALWLLCCTAQWRIGYVAPHKDHTAIVVMLHRTIVAMLHRNNAFHIMRCDATMRDRGLFL